MKLRKELFMIESILKSIIHEIKEDRNRIVEFSLWCKIKNFFKILEIKEELRQIESKVYSIMDKATKNKISVDQVKAEAEILKEDLEQVFTKILDISLQSIY